MFSDTGNLSFWLSLFFVLISLCGIFFAYLLARNKSLEPEYVDKFIDLGKWFIVSVAITLSTSIVNDGFRERDQDIKEMEIFDNYTSVILEADGLIKRKLLSEYFATVSPEGPIKQSWTRYEEKIDDHIREIEDSEEKVIELGEKTEKGNASPADIMQLDRLVEKAASLNQSLLPSSAHSELKPRVYFHIRNESQRAKAVKIASEIALHSDVGVPGVQRVDRGPLVSELRYFRRSEEQEARQISEALASLGLKLETKYISGYELSTSIRPRHYELWFSEEDLPPD